MWAFCRQCKVLTSWRSPNTRGGTRDRGYGCVLLIELRRHFDRLDMCTILRQNEETHYRHQALTRNPCLAISHPRQSSGFPLSAVRWSENGR